MNEQVIKDIRANPVYKIPLNEMFTPFDRFIMALGYCNQKAVQRGGKPFQLGNHDYRKLNPGKRNPI